MTPPLPARHLGVAIDRPPAEVYAFAARPENLPRWARGLGTSIAQVAGEWIAETPAGQVKVRLAARNALGVLDHDVVLPDGATVHVPLRVLPNGRGSEVVLTLFRLPGTADEAFAADVAAVERDLTELKRVLEGG